MSFIPLSLPTPLDEREIAYAVAMALAEDIGEGDITSRAVIPEGTMATCQVRTREPVILAGVDFATSAFRQCDPDIRVDFVFRDGAEVPADTVLATVQGLAQPILAAERTAVNFLQILSGIATLTYQYAHALRDTRTRLLDTRKTLPGLRLASKYATAVGGACNHRFRLDDAILIKDNHVALSGTSLARTIERAKHTGKSVLVECDTLEQVREALTAGADWLLLDNMTIPDYREAVSIVNGRIPTEASGGITLNNCHAIAMTGVDYLSVGALTHSAKAVDIGLDVGTGLRSVRNTRGSLPYIA